MSQNGINSLQRFRYTKRVSSKEEEYNSSNSSEEIQNLTASGKNQLTSYSPDGNSEATPNGTTESPVFNKKFGRPATSCNSAKGSSPWLSKSSGVKTAQTNGISTSKQKNKPKAKNKYKRVRTFSSSDSDSENETDTCSLQTPESLSQSPGKKISSKNGLWEEKLTDMFPSATRLQIQAAIVAGVRSNNLEAGVDYLVKGHSSTKRKHNNSDNEDKVISSKNKCKSFKRIRTMSGDSEDSSGPASVMLSSQVSDNGDLPDLTDTDSQSHTASQDASLAFLQGAFTTLPKKRLVQVLQDCQGNTDQAVIVLSSDVQEAESQTSPKHTKATKVHTANTVNRKVVCDSDGDEDYDEDEEDSDDSLDGEENSGKRESVLSFMEEATLPELMFLPGCSRKKAEALADLRPFGSWENLMKKLSNCKQVSHSLVHGCHEVIGLRNGVMQLMKQCEQISEQMELVVSKLTGKLRGQRDEEDQITIQPELLNGELELKPYQLIGLNWLRIMHSQHLNGILADEMGLGKTVQAISFLAHLLGEGEEGPHVIVVPSSTIENWLRELSTWCPALGVIVYYGSQEERRATRHSIMYDGREDFHVLLTTYNIATGTGDDRSLFKKFQFHYAVFDEGHMLKNMSSLRFQNLMKISAERRLLLTGTPLQNNLLELMSLLCFVMPDIFQGKTESLKKIFSMITKGESNDQGKYEKERIAQAQRIMRPFVLRRLKKDVLTQLPKKEEEVLYCPLLAEQQDLYSSLLQQFSQEVEREGPGEGAGMAMFMQLRKAANHPLLLRKHYDEDKLRLMAHALAKEHSHRERGALPELIMEDMAVMNDFELMALCRQYKKQIGKYELDPSWIRESAKFYALDSLLATMKEQKDRVLVFSQFTMMLDVVEVYLRQKQLRFLRLDGSTPVPDRQRLIDEFNNDDEIFIFLLSTRAGGLGINLTSANRIILHDIDFNPYNDKQAEDRCHRMGQKRTVKITRLIAQNTVEEGMLRCARAKLRLEQDVTTANDDQDEAQPDVANLLREAISKAKNTPTNSTKCSTTIASSSCSS